MSRISQLGAALAKIAQMNGTPLDVVRLKAAMDAITTSDTQLTLADVQKAATFMGWPLATAMSAPDRARLPLLVELPELGWGVLTDLPGGEGMLVEVNGQRHEVEAGVRPLQVIRVALPKRSGANPNSFKVQLGLVFRRYRSTIGEAIAASFLINLLTAIVSFFSLQVYDKVIPSRSIDTLTVMMIGVLFVIVVEWTLKWARSRVMDRAVVGMDGRLSRDIFERLLKVRLDQMPGSVGSLASQLRGYEQVRNFYTASTLFSLVDLPAALIFIAIIAAVATPWLALVPLTIAVISLVVGLLFRRRVQLLATIGVKESNMKTGLLVEAVEGAETIKAAQGGWQFLSKWVDLSGAAIGNDLRMRHTNDGLAHYLAAAQQISYVSLVGLGAWFVVQGDMTMGALIASSILGGRVLSAVMQMPNLMVQHAHAKAASDGLEAIYALKGDNHGIERPLQPSLVRGNYSLQGVAYAYPDSPPAIQVGDFQVRPGERIGVIGPIGSGKSTLLKMMAGLYHPSQGRVLVDGMDIAQIGRESLARQVGYLQQDHRLFQGTLRENLLVGIPEPGDDMLQQVLAMTGLSQLVAAHPRGLELPIYEGGRGLSGGQKQLLAFTRMVLARPNVLLMDEPTASMDEGLERRCLQILSSEAFAKKTLLLVTHKPSVLVLVDRLVAVAGGRIVLDGPKDEVLAKLQQPQQKPGLAKQAGTAVVLASPNGNPTGNPGNPGSTGAQK